MNYKISNEASTTMMKVGARLDETRSYLNYFDINNDLKIQKEKAWNEQWFGFLPEQILETVVYSLYQRFGQFSLMTKVLKSWLNKGLDNHDFKLICHFHIQLTEPFYRWATGQYFSQRYNEAYDDIPSTVLAKQLEKAFMKEKDLSSQSYQRLAIGILSTARDLGLLKGKAQKLFAKPLVSIEFLGYLIYTLQHFMFPFAELPSSPYIQSILRDESQLKRLLTEGQRKNWWEFNWDHGLFSLYPKFSDIEQWYKEAIQ